jgi:hypothetical protein
VKAGITTNLCCEQPISIEADVKINANDFIGGYDYWIQ